MKHPDAADSESEIQATKAGWLFGSSCKEGEKYTPDTDKLGYVQKDEDCAKLVAKCPNLYNDSDTLHVHENGFKIKCFGIRINPRDMSL